MNENTLTEQIADNFRVMLMISDISKFIWGEIPIEEDKAGPSGPAQEL